MKHPLSQQWLEIFSLVSGMCLGLMLINIAWQSGYNNALIKSYPRSLNFSRDRLSRMGNVLSYEFIKKTPEHKGDVNDPA